jgi:hypothetical protein
MAAWIGMQAYTKPGMHAWVWYAPSYRQCAIGMELIADLWRPVIKSGPMKSPPYPCTLLSGGRIEWRSWDDHSNLMGQTILGGVVDEAGLLNPQAQAAISTRRSGTMGPLKYIGNPGMVAGPFRKLCSLAEEDTTGTYSLHRWTWHDKHAALPLEEAAAYESFIEQERLSQPEYEFRRLYEAEWTSDEAAVFRNVHECTVPRRPIQEGRQYVIGVDVGQSVDYMAAVVLDLFDYRVDDMDRYRGVGYPEVAQRLKDLQHRASGAPLVVEVNGPGVALIQELERCGAAYIPFTTTSQSKQEIILNLAAAFQQKRIQVADLPPLQYELEVFRYNRLPSGVYRYEAPAGEHDDTVMALALANWGRQNAVTDLSAYGWIA